MNFLFELYRKINKLPNKVCIEACSLCQLNCRDCYMRKDDKNCIIGNGYLKFKDFKKFIEKHPYIKDIELSLSGEIFLNPELLEIIKYAYEKNVKLTAFNGVNFNTVSDEMLEALVKYKFTGITFSIDGTSQKTYEMYRRNGNFDKVIENIKKLNKYKEKYNSKFPILNWQYIVFEHNKHEIIETTKLKEELKITMLYFKEPWGSGGFDIETKIEISQVQKTFNKETDNEIIQILKENNIYLCLYPWLKPQINWNGTLLGCCCSTHHDLTANVFKDGLKKALNNKKVKYMKAVLTGKSQSDETLHCTYCPFYLQMKRNNKFITESTILKLYKDG